MSRIFYVSLIIFSLFGISACGEQGNSKQPGKTPVPQPTTVQPSTHK